MLMLGAPRRQETFVGLLTPAQTARSIGVSVQELNAMRQAGTGPAAFALTPRVVRYARSEVGKWSTQTTS